MTTTEKPALKAGDIITIVGRRWFQRTYGNTYHTVSVSVNGVSLGTSLKQYGYGDQYKQTAHEMLEQHYETGLQRYAWGGREPLWHLRDRGITVDDHVSDVARERDL